MSPEAHQQGDRVAGKTVSVVLLGCSKNQVDAEFMLGGFDRYGYSYTPDVVNADLIVIMTCGFLSAAVAESYRVIRRIVRLKRSRPGSRVVVAGCLVQRFGQELCRSFPEVDLWVGLDELRDIPRLLRLEEGFRCSATPRTLPSGSLPRLRYSPSHYAYLKIADGCSNRCSYCLIPSIRGALRSRPISDILAEAEALVADGVRELILVAQDTTAYGFDLTGSSQLPRLLAALQRVPGLCWLRLMYCHPAHLGEEVIDQFRRNPRLCRYIDLPVQHVAPRILARMGRHYTRASLVRLLARLRCVPDLSLRTTVITGFPGETAAEFRQLLDFVRRMRFDRLSGYAYSAEPGTEAAMFSEQIPLPVRVSRLRRIVRLQAAISRARLRRFVGREIDVMVDSPRRGRTEWDAPEVDGVVRIIGADPEPGSLVRCRVVRSLTHDLIARVL